MLHLLMLAEWLLGHNRLKTSQSRWSGPCWAVPHILLQCCCLCALLPLVMQESILTAMSGLPTAGEDTEGAAGAEAAAALEALRRREVRAIEGPGRM